MSNRVLVRDASYRRGFSGTDHLLNDDDFRPVVGRAYPSASAAQAAAERCVRSRGPDRRSPISLDLLRFADPPDREEIAAAVEREQASLPRCTEVSVTSEPYARDGWWLVDIEVRAHTYARVTTESRTVRVRSSD